MKQDIKYFTLHRKERELNSVTEPNDYDIPQVGRFIIIEETRKKGNEKLKPIECVVIEEYPHILRVDVIEQVKSKACKDKYYTYSESFRKDDFKSGFLKYKYV